ncbi:MAG: hypothetical protein ACUVWZ_02750 [Anaerolineae bacterium]
MEKRFTALRIIGTVLKVLAWVILVFGVIGAIITLLAGVSLGGPRELPGLGRTEGLLGGLAMFFVVLISAIVGFLFYYAAGEAVYLLLAIEENTRRTAYFFQQQVSTRQASYPPPGVPPSYRG